MEHSMINPRQYYGAFDEDGILLDYNFFEEVVWDWADGRFKGEMYFIGKVEFSELEQIKIGWNIHDEPNGGDHE
jgi:hypothetical protein